MHLAKSSESRCSPDDREVGLPWDWCLQTRAARTVRPAVPASGDLRWSTGAEGRHRRPAVRRSTIRHLRQVRVRDLTSVTGVPSASDARIEPYQGGSARTGTVAKALSG